MALRFCRRVSLIPGLRLNLSRSGPSLSIGGRGKWYTIGTSATVTRNCRTAGNGIFWAGHAPAEDLQRYHLPPTAPSDTADLKTAERLLATLR